MKDHNPLIQEDALEHHEHGCCGENGNIIEELAFHFPYAVYAVALTIALCSFFVLGGAGITQCNLEHLFHSFHFMHIVFAATGTLITYFRFSRNMFGALIVGLIVPSVFCVLSDVIMPYYGGKMLGIDMHWHVCFQSEWHNVLPFLFMGMLNGFVLSRHGADHQEAYSIVSHFTHILVSSLASAFYLIAHGFDTWYLNIGSFFLFLIIVVVVPCTLGDVVVPMFFARMRQDNEEHKA
jgi:hypothetical protein